MGNGCDCYHGCHSCLVLRTSSPSESLSRSHSIQTTAVPKEERIYLNSGNTSYRANILFIIFIYVMYWLQELNPGSITWCEHSHPGSNPRSWAPWQTCSRQGSSHNMTAHSEDQPQEGRAHTQCLFVAWKLKQVNRDMIKQVCFFFEGFGLNVGVVKFG